MRDKLEYRTEKVKVITTPNDNTFSVTLPKGMTYKGRTYTVDWTSVKLQDNGTGYFATAVYESDQF